MTGSRKFFPERHGRTTPEGQVRLSEFYDDPDLLDNFPLVFSNGARWNEFVANCVACRGHIKPGNIRGTVETAGKDNYREHTIELYLIDARCYCEPCNLVMPFRYALNDKMDLIGITSDVDGKTWLSLYGKSRKNLLARALDRVKAWIQA